MFIQLSRVPRTDDDSLWGHWRYAVVRHTSLKLRTMSRKTVRPAKWVCNCAIVVALCETFGQDIVGPVSTGLCTACRNTFLPIGSFSAVIDGRHHSRTLPLPLSLHCRLKRASWVDSRPACRYARLWELWISTLLSVWRRIPPVADIHVQGRNRRTRTWSCPSWWRTGASATLSGDRMLDCQASRDRCRTRRRAAATAAPARASS